MLAVVLAQAVADHLHLAAGRGVVVVGEEAVGDEVLQLCHHVRRPLGRVLCEVDVLHPQPPARRVLACR